MTPPVLTVDPAPEPPAPPPLLDADTGPDSLVVQSLVPAPAIATSEPIPMAGADNCIGRDSNGRFMGWVDRNHCIYSGRTLAGARWFDDLFGDWYDNEARVLVRIISETGFAEGQNASSTIQVRASAELPNAKKRLRLVITDDSDRDERLSGQDALSQLNRTSGKVSAAVRLTPADRGEFESDLDVGVRGVDPPDFFARARLRNHWSISRDALFRFGQTFRYGSDSRGRSITQLDVERVLNESSVARISSGYEYDELEHANGFNWGHGLSLSHVLGDTRSLGYGVALSGHTAPNWRGENYGSWLVYRCSFLRPWLFYELEPRLTWYRDRNWGSVASIVLRFEIQLGRK